MDSNPDVPEYGSCAKRLKIDNFADNVADLSDGAAFTCFSAIHVLPIDAAEASTDCDSGYEASTMESLPTPLHSTNTSPLITESEGDGMSNFFPTPTHENLDNLNEEEEEEDDDNVSTVSNLSDLSGLSNLSGEDWKPMGGSMAWVHQQMQKGINPRSILNELGYEQIPNYFDDLTLWKVVINMLSEPPRRSKLRHVNTLDDVVRLLKGAQRIIVLTGAGVSVSCGIPDFRSRDGIYSRLAVEFRNLPGPQAMFDIQYFSKDPRPFFKFAKDIYPGKFQPSPCHRFIKLLERHNKLLRNYTQNIDTLEKEAQIENVIECHGSFATASCTKCEHKVAADKIRDVVLEQKIPLCDMCHGDNGASVSTDEEDNDKYKDLVLSGIMKPDIVFFGEGLPDTFHEHMAQDKNECDLLLVIGSSLKVRPVALIPSSLPSHVPQILINREPLPHCHFDVELLGDCDGIINHLCQLLGDSWEEALSSEKVLKESDLMGEVSFDVNKWSEEAGKEFEEAKLKERHMSIDSARDSGIGENSNLTDLDVESKEAGSFDASEPSCSFKKEQDMRGYWQPKVKKSLADRLPADSYHLIPPSRYIFPGAEVFYDPDDKSSPDKDDSSSYASECC